jgi:hypothetical protein
MKKIRMKAMNENAEGIENTIKQKKELEKVHQVIGIEGIEEDIKAAQEKTMDEIDDDLLNSI